ncbi:MAG: TetR/AcrR family transcriptional regulator [Candidatus Gallimonas sp.]
MEKTLDLRIQKTHKALIRALQELLCEKDFDDITVVELCKRAEIRKATFYKHFGDKSGLFIFMLEELQNEYAEQNERDYRNGNSQAYYLGMFKYIVDFLEQHEKMILMILNSNSRWQLIDLLSKQAEYDLRIHLKEDAKKGILQSSPEFIATILTGALVQAACSWILNQNWLSKEEAIKQFTDLIMKVY